MAKRSEEVGLKIKKWIFRNFSNIFKFHLQIPFIYIKIDLLTQYHEGDAVYNLAFDINIFGLKIYFVWGEKSRHKLMRNNKWD
jgi:hypothetical protein